MDYAKLTVKVTEVLGDHPDWTDQQIAEHLNSPTIEVLQPIPSTELLAWSGGAGRFARISKATESQNDQVASMANAAKVLILRDGTALDLSLPDRAAMLDALVAAEVLTPDGKASLYSLATGLVSWAEQVGVGRVKAGYVQNARS